MEDKPGVLNRVASLFRRRSFNIDSLNVGATQEPGVSRMTIVCDADEDKAKRIEANLYKMVNVLWVDDITHKQTIDRTLALIKVNCNARAARRSPEDLRRVPRARDRHVARPHHHRDHGTPGTRSKASSRLLRPFGILELVQTGTVAMTRGVEKHDLAHPTVPASRNDAA